MKSTIFKTIIIGLTAAGLAGCASRALQVQNPIVDITITESSSGAVTITVDPYELDLTGRPAGNKTLLFKLTSSVFSFVPIADKPIEIPNDPGNQFSDHARGRQGKVITVKDKNNDGFEYHYTLRVVDSAGRKIELDPLIKNRD